ncbi:MAG: substrate-binding periplasmic protein [Rhodoferax sp.]
MKIFRWMAAAVLAVCAWPASALVVGLYELSPHMAVEGQQEPGGVVVEYLREVLAKAPELGPVEWRVANFARTLRELEAGQIDLVFMVAKNEQRSKLFRYSSVPVFETRSAVLTLRNAHWASLSSLEQLRGMRIGHAHASIIPEYFNGLGVEFQSITGDDYFVRGLRMVELGRHDAYFAPTLSNAQYQLKRLGLSEVFTVHAMPVEPLALYVVFSKQLDERLFARLDGLIVSNLSRYRVLLASYPAR